MGFCMCQVILYFSLISFYGQDFPDLFSTKSVPMKDSLRLSKLKKETLFELSLFKEHCKES